MIKKIITIIFLYNVIFCLFAEEMTNEIEISSETMEWKREENIAIAIGEAKAIQGRRILTADKIVIFFNKNRDINKIFKLDALGEVKFVNGKQIANGDKATFFIDNDKIIIKGNVKLEREDSFMIGEELSIDLKNDSTKLISSEKSGKVKAKYKTEDKQ